MRAATYFSKALRVLSRSRSAMSMASDADRHERQAARRCSAGDQRRRPRAHGAGTRCSLRRCQKMNLGGC